MKESIAYCSAAYQLSCDLYQLNAETHYSADVLNFYAERGEEVPPHEIHHARAFDSDSAFYWDMVRDRLELQLLPEEIEECGLDGENGENVMNELENILEHAAYWSHEWSDECFALLVDAEIQMARLGIDELGSSYYRWRHRMAGKLRDAA